MPWERGGVREASDMDAKTAGDARTGPCPQDEADALRPRANGAEGGEGPTACAEPLSTERAARLSRIEEIIDNVDGIVWEVDADTFRFTYVSAQAEHILGYPIARWMEEPTFWVDHIHPEDRHRCLEFCRGSTARGEPHQFEYRMIASDGRIVWLRDYVRVLFEEGRPARLRGVMVDITEWKLVQEERDRLLVEERRLRADAERARGRMEESLALLEEAIRARDDFLSIASHELKTPLTTLTLRLEQLVRRVRAGQPVDGNHVGLALAQVDRLTALTNDLLDVSRIASGRLTIRKEPISLAALVREAVANAGVDQGKHAIALDEVREDMVVAGDSDRLQQVLVNLLDNAIKYTPMGGTIRVSLSQRDGEAVLSVADPGIGIPKEQQGMLFERFFRAQNAPSSSYGGLGLGLHICRDIVERHGGRIWVESDVGRGSIFRVALPIG